MRIERGRWLIALWWLLMAPWAWAGMPAAAAACPGNVADLASTTGLAAVSRDDLTVDDVTQWPASRFQSIDAGRLLSHGETSWWLRLDLHNATDRTCRRWLLIGPARLRNVSVYVREGQGWRVMHSGTDYPMREWALPVRMPVFPVTVAPHATITVLAWVPGRGGLMSFTPQLWNPVRFQKVEADRSLGRGLMYGCMFLLVITSLILAGIYRRPALCYMALGVGFYVAYIMAQNNYFFLYLWPDSPRLNLWARVCLTALYLAAAWAYLCEIVRLRQLGKWWARLFVVMLCGFLSCAPYGILTLSMSSQPSIDLVLILEQTARWLLLIAVVIAWRRGLVRSWFPPVLIGCLFLRNLQLYGYLLGLPVSPPGGIHMFAVTILVAGLFLLGTLVVEVLAGRRQQLQAQAALDRQRETETQRLEQTVALRTGELERALEARSRLLGHISHDLRSPLVGILDSVRLWRRGDAGRDHARMIEQYTRWQMDLIDELLDYSHSELPDLEICPEPGYLHAFLQDVVEQAELLVARRHNRLEVTLSEGLPGRVRADFHHLRRVLINLLGNAAKFTEHGCIRLTVQTRPVSSAGHAGLHFMVDDDGPGMAPADRERLVLPYARGESAKGHEGVGLGLAIVSSLLQRMDSKLHIDESPDGGSRFHFMVEVELEAEAAMEPMIDSGEHLDIDGHDRVVLVVDDDRQLRELASDLLDGYGFDTVTAAGVAGALDILRTRHVDMVVTDQCMDGMDGWELLRRIRGHHPGLPVMLYSAMPAQCPANMVAGLAFDAAVLKPADGATLVRLVASMLEDAPRGPVVASDGLVF